VRTIYLNGEYLPETGAKISIFDRGLLFADAVYEVVSVLDGKLVDFAGHMTRLSRSLGELSMPEPLAEADWLALTRELVARNSVNEGIVYWQVTRGNPGDRDFMFPDKCTPTVIAFTQSRPLVDSPSGINGVSVVTLPDLRWGRADIKTTQLLYASMMKSEAKQLGADDAWLERDGLVTEGTAQNTHIITNDGILLTHPLNRGILHGITRAAALPMLSAQNIVVEQRAFSVEEAENAAEAFTTSASGFVTPVVKINGKTIGNGSPGSATVQLRAAYINWARANAL
jgi:D-alanine transaminase